jgi:hypothetical protein
VISSSSNDEIEIFEDDEVTAEEKNKATCDLHDLGIPVFAYIPLQIVYFTKA